MADPFVRPDVRAFLDYLAGLGRPAGHEVGPEGARQMMVASRHAFDAPMRDIAVIRDIAGPVPLRLYDAREDRAPGPLLAFIHGGGWVIGGIGTHETALASPDRVDLGGRCVLPGFNDAHVHFPTWALAQRQIRLEDATSLEEALDRVAAAAADVQPDRWLRGLGWRSGDWSPRVEPTKEDLDRVTGDIPTALSRPRTTRATGSGSLRAGRATSVSHPRAGAPSSSPTFLNPHLGGM